MDARILSLDNYDNDCAPTLQNGSQLCRRTSPEPRRQNVAVVPQLRRRMGGNFSGGHKN